MKLKSKLMIMVIGVILPAGVCAGQVSHQAVPSGCATASNNVTWMKQWVDDGKEYESDRGMKRRVVAKNGELDFQEDLPNTPGGAEFEQRNIFVALKDVGNIEEPSQDFNSRWSMTVRAREGGAEGPFRITMQTIQGTKTVQGPDEVARAPYYIINFPNERSAQAAYAYLRCKAR